MIDRRGFLGLAAGAVCAVAVGATTAGCSTADTVTLRMATGEPGGFFAEFGSLLAQAAAQTGSVRVAPNETGGSAANLQLLRNGNADLALSLSDTVIGDHAAGVRYAAVGRVYENYMQLAVRTDSPIRTVDDLRGTRISVGAPGSGSTLTSDRILAAAGLGGPGAVERVQLPIQEAARRLATGDVDAVLWAGGIPTPTFVDPPVPIRLIDLSETVDRLQRTYGPVYERVPIRANTYGEHPGVATVGLANLLLAADTVSDDAVGGIVDLLIDRAAELVPAQAIGSQFLDRQSLIVTGSVPLHAGAVAAYRRRHG
ncbi:TAXI family TRAP transporter solute-binding subunit [Gordonia sp. NB41Y]|uniref:TAXI family TRAP transporter solute-binding subunit n=1 Tax=Gordonia sp. NB41Y TaxID=875808 RepID=UPI0006B1E345|nr:TAXI family TRAP transporter solute-binding subunit [Gordonia sp. NB41Y]EMP11190.2 TRAP transporter [Gordonia sp. NB41Y]WLP89928.1 TAXI family TRAP transporter solute-binding subunit [Gordonia sp. NB41Y]